MYRWRNGRRDVPRKHILTSSDLDRAERQLFLGLSIGPEVTDDLLADEIPPPAHDDQADGTSKDDPIHPVNSQGWRFNDD